jgi:SAM-dependent methyltransferase
MASRGEQDFSTVADYVERQRALPLDARADEFESLLQRIRKLRPLPPGSSVCEIGVGGGWFLINAARAGMKAHGLEINPELAALARERASSAGVAVEIEVGDVETDPLPRAAYDLVVANSVLEHVPDWRAAVRNIHASLRDHGVFYFDSSNKFALRSGEYPALRLYGWLPFAARRRIRIAQEGPEVVTSRRMDFNQFTYPGLRCELKRSGFRQVIDIFDLLDVEDLNRPSRPRVAAMKAYKRVPPLKALLTTFASGTYYFCVK